MVQYLEEPSASTGNDLLVHRQVAVSIGQGLCVGNRGDKKLRSADNDPAVQAISATNVTKQVVHGKLDGLLGGHTDQIGADAWSTHTHTHTHTDARQTLARKRRLPWATYRGTSRRTPQWR